MSSEPTHATPGFRYLCCACGCIVCAAHDACAAIDGKVWRVAYLHPTGSLLFDVFRAEMRKLGYIEEAKTLSSTTGMQKGRLNAYLRWRVNWLRAGPDVIVAVATPAIAAAQHATSTIPIIMAPATDPVGSGFIKSLAHPGGNITGLANLFGNSIGKSVELIHTILPSAKRVAVLMSSNPTHPQQLELVESASKTLNLAVIRVMASTLDDLEQAFEDGRGYF